MQASITGKTSLHEGARFNLYHDWRDYNDLKWNKDDHIDYSRSVLNEYEDWKGNKLTGIVPCQENVNLAPDPLDFFEDTFGKSLSDFNEKNKEKHPDRVKTMEQYYKQQKKNVREVIVQLSDHDNYVKLCQEIGQKAADDFHMQFLHECVDHWKEHYVNDGAGLVPISIAIHMDETLNGTPHAQITFVRVGKSNRGMKLKASCDGAMEAIGIKKHGEKGLVYRDWLDHARDDFEDIARKYINLVPHAKATVPHTDPKNYNAKQKQKKKASQKEAEEFKQAAKSKTSTSRIYKDKVLLSEDDFNDLVDIAAEGYAKQIELDKANEKVENFGRSLLEARSEINRGKEETNQAKRKADKEIADKEAKLEKERQAFEWDKKQTAQKINFNWGYLDDEKKKLEEKEKAIAERENEANRLYQQQRSLNAIHNDTVAELDKARNDLAKANYNADYVERDLIKAVRGINWLISQSMDENLTEGLTNLKNRIYGNYNNDMILEFNVPLRPEEQINLIPLGFDDNNNRGRR